MQENDIKLLEEKAKKARQAVLEMCVTAGEGRIASALSCMEVLVALYNGVLRYDPKNPVWEGRDRFIMSKSPGVVGLYPVLSEAGVMPAADVEQFCRLNGPGPYGDNIPGVEAVWGSLGHGLGVGAGIALAAKMDKKDFMTFVMLGDGECYEGSVWEAAMFAGHHRLDNLVAVIDRNKICTIDFTENCLRLEPFAAKWKDFGWEAVTINGHSFKEIMGVLGNCRGRKSGKPLAVIADTVKGKGISQLENNPMGHVIIPSGGEVDKARKELR